MEIFLNIFNFLETNKIILTFIVIVITGFWQYWKFTKEWNFRNYHKLIKELNQSDTDGESIKLYRQVAVVYELRNYPRYFSVSKRILQGWLDSKDDKEGEFKNLYNEMKLSIEFMNKNYFQRLLNKNIT